LEEAELELDRVCVLEVDTYESIRRNEIETIEKAVGLQKSARVRREKQFWKVEGIRKNVIARYQRKNKAHLIDQVDIKYGMFVMRV
jgi:hypothetical protein